MMKNFILCVVIAFITQSGTSYAQFSRLDNTSEQRIADSANAILSNTNAVGLAIGVIRNGQVVYLRGFGLADKSPSSIDLVDECTLFRWASVSKTVSATRAMQLIENGELALGDDIRDYVWEFPAKPQGTITVNHLLTHQSGMINYTNWNSGTRDDYISRYPTFNAVKAIDCFKNGALNFTPGNSAIYATFNTNLLGAVIERASNGGFERQIRRNIAEVLGMHTFQPEYAWRNIPNRAELYNSSGNTYSSPRTNDGTDISWKLPAGGYVGSITDLALFARGFMNGSLFNNANTLTTMGTFTNVVTVGAGSARYGTGFFLETRGAGAPTDNILWHGGSQGGCSALIYLDPANQNGVVILCNTQGVDLAVFNAARGIYDRIAASTVSGAQFNAAVPSDNSSKSLSGQAHYGVNKYEYNTITASNYVVGFLDDVRLIAGEKVVLKKGFHASSSGGGRFLAHIEVTNDNCRSGSSSKLSSFDEQNEDELPEVFLYPNPTEGLIYINKEEKWQLYSAMGNYLFEGTGNVIDLNSVASGVYLVKIGNEYLRIIKN